MLGKQGKRIAVGGAIAIVAFSMLVAVTLQVLKQFPPVKAANSEFLVEPYLQLGRLGNPARPQILWATTASDADWQIRVQATSQWQALVAERRRIDISNMPRFYIFSAQLPPLPVDSPVAYQVIHHQSTVFSSRIHPLKADGESYTVDVAGDIANGSRDEQLVARRIYASNPDLFVIPGDVVYSYGRSREYLDHFFPVYNADEKTQSGVPMMRSFLFVAAPGNHDTAYGARHDTRDLGLFPDALAYFLWWRLPLNGPPVTISAGDAAQPYGSAQAVENFETAAADSFPREENYSFDMLNSHWTMLDANPYMDWHQLQLRQWLQKDLASTSKPWKFVVFHQTAFSSDPSHFHDQQMRVIADLLQDNKVDIVFAGHVHNYQRTYPLKFLLRKQPDGNWRRADGIVDGKFDLDKIFDGKSKTNPGAPIYITTGGGGGILYGSDFANQPQAWQPFTCKFISRHSFTRCDFSGRHLHVQQIAEDGTVLDDFSIDKPGAT